MPTSSKNKGRLLERGIRYPIQELPPQPEDTPGFGWGSDPSLVTHKGITCAGPLCKSKHEFIQGTRYKCSVCPRIDFCNACIREPENEHEETHTLLACHGEADFREAADTKSWPPDQLPEFDEGGPLGYLDLSGDPSQEDSPKNNGTYSNGPRTESKGHQQKRQRATSIKHHNDPQLLVDVMLGRITRFLHHDDDIRRLSKSGSAAMRLIELCPGEQSDRLRCNFRAVKLDEAPTYESLCFAWKEKQCEKPSLEEQCTRSGELQFERDAIYVGGYHFMGISPRLGEALRAIRKTDETRILWVEELCINEENKRERIFQKRAVGLIHSRAAATIVWAGQGDDDTESVFGLMEQLACRCDCEDASLPTPQAINEDLELGLAPTGSEDWQALAHFLPTLALNRGWEYHDLSFARDPVLMCGVYGIECRKVANVARLLCQAAWKDEVGFITTFPVEAPPSPYADLQPQHERLEWPVKGSALNYPTPESDDIPEELARYVPEQLQRAHGVIPEAGGEKAESMISKPSRLSGSILEAESLFVSHLIENLQLESTQQRWRLRDILDRMTELLHKAARLLSDGTPDGLRGKASSFLFNSHERILAQLRTFIEPSNDPNVRNDIFATADEGPTTAKAHIGNLGDPTEQTAEIPYSPEINENDIETEQTATSYHAVSVYLESTNEYRWLIHQTRLMLSFDLIGNANVMLKTQDQLMQEVLRSNHNCAAGRLSLELNLPWQPVNFLTEQFDYKTVLPALSSTIVLSGIADTIYTTTCGQYVQQMWPVFGCDVLSMLESVIKGTANVNTNNITTLNEFLGISFDASGTQISAVGTPLFLIEAAEVFIWLSIACRSSGLDQGIRYSQANDLRCRSASSQDKLNLTLQYSLQEIENEARGTCWHDLFRSPVIAWEYPIPKRLNGELGMEASLEMIVALAQTPWVMIFGEEFILKGFNSMMIPVHRFTSSILWHCAFEKDGIPLNSSSDRSESCFRTSEEALRADTRHFVGWTNSCIQLIGTDEPNYAACNRSRCNRASSGICIEPKLSLAAGQYISLGIEISRGSKDIPIYLRPRSFEEKIRHAASWNIIISDATAQRHWFTDGASTILHLCRLFLARRHADNASTECASKIRHDDACESSTAALQTLLNPNNRALLAVEPNTMNGPLVSGALPRISSTQLHLEEQASRFWDMLDMIQERRRQTHRQQSVSISRGVQIVGFDMIDLVEDYELRPLKLDLQPSAKAWAKFASKIDTINLFVSNTGELIKPSRTECPPVQCPGMCTVPQGRDYLAVPLTRLATMAERHRGHADNSVQLADKVFWEHVNACFSTCACRANSATACSIFVRKLKSKDACHKASISLERHPVFSSFPLGAIIIGDRSGTNLSSEKSVCLQNGHNVLPSPE